MFTVQLKKYIARKTYIKKNQSGKANFGGNQTAFPTNSLLKGSALPVQRQKKNRRIPSETDIKTFIPPTTFFLHAKKNV